MMIYTHAVTNYIERVLGIERERAGKSVEMFAREQIEKAVKEPERVHHKSRVEGENCPIHIRNMAAVPVRNGQDEKRIPTAYHAAAFIEEGA